MGTANWRPVEGVTPVQMDCPECSGPRSFVLYRVKYGLSVGVPFLRSRTDKAYAATNVKYALGCTTCDSLYEIEKRAAKEMMGK